MPINKWSILFNTLILANLPVVKYPPSPLPLPFGPNDNLYSMRGVRENRGDLQVYSIDPSGCTDADDAFTIWEEREREGGEGVIHLMVHIADPTSYFTPDEHDSVFQSIRNNVTSWYPSGNPTNHMFSDEFVEKCTLTHGFKNTITVHIRFTRDTDGILSILDHSIHYYIIDCDRQKRFTYETAGYAFESGDDVLRIGNEIREYLFKSRSHENEFIQSAQEELRYDNLLVDTSGIVSLTRDTESTRLMKLMIQEFAIIANRIVANEIIHNTSFLVRGFQIGSAHEDKPSSNILSMVLQSDGAKYTNDIIQHNLIGKDMYTHFTSPLRRFSDCIVHFLLKDYTLENGKCTFDEDTLVRICDRCTKVSKNARNLNFLDRKIRYLQYISQELQAGNDVCITQYPYAYNGLFLNIAVTKINNWDCYFSYSLRRKNLTIELNKTTIVRINKVTLPGKFDEGTLPDLDKLYS